MRTVHAPRSGPAPRARTPVPPGFELAAYRRGHHAPCVSIHYALAQAQPGNTVKVGAGIFDLSGIDPETYLHGPVHAAGGYDEANHYVESRPERVQSIVFGVLWSVVVVPPW